MTLFSSCKGQKKPNHLIDESSPYLLQHAYNPVDWHPWNEKTLQMAKAQNKMLLISVGYAACHWCHVMEKECFEDAEVAEIMNKYFINVKVDREERPEVDKIYMTALQLITGNGGWPLNCVTLPDGKPFWGATYLPKESWKNVLKQIGNLYEKNPEKIKEAAQKLTEGIRTANLITPNTQPEFFSKETLKKAVADFMQKVDTVMGGMNYAPKFPMPTNYHYLLKYVQKYKDEKVANFVELTLNKMALGGIFDHIGGGFARYSTDAKWHIPHFEKMLYDNAQLVSLYSDAYLYKPNKLYKQTVYQTLAFVENTLTDATGGFYSSLDADSENERGHLEEGAFYVWTREELKSILKEDYNAFAAYYNVNDFGHWEGENYHLIRNKTGEDSVLEKTIANCRKKLYQQREKRSHPRLDDKIITSWNAWMLKAYVDAYRVFGERTFLEKALNNANFIKNKMRNPQKSLYRIYKNNKATISGSLEDYAAVMQAFISLYEQTLDQQWLNESNELVTYCFEHFYDSDSKMFFFSDNTDPQLISPTVETQDNVIPSSNSVLAKALFRLGHYFENKKYRDTAQQMLLNMQKLITQYGLQSHSNWLDLYQDIAEDFYEVVVVGKDALQKIQLLNKVFIPNKIIAGSTAENNSTRLYVLSLEKCEYVESSTKNTPLPLLKNRYQKGKTMIYVCQQGVCKMPTEKVGEAVKNLKK